MSAVSTETVNLYQRLAKVAEGVGTIKATGRTAQGESTLSIVDVEDALRLLLSRNGIITGYRWNTLPLIVGQEGKLTLWQADLTVWIRSTDSEELLEDRICDIGSSPSSAVSFALKRYYRALFHLADAEDEGRAAEGQTTTRRPQTAQAARISPKPVETPAAPSLPTAPGTSGTALQRLQAAMTRTGTTEAQALQTARKLFGSATQKIRLLADLSDEQIDGLAGEIEVGPAGAKGAAS